MEDRNQQIRQGIFARRLKERLDSSSKEEHQKLAEKLSKKDIQLLVNLFFEELSHLLRSGFRVVFEGYASFYTNAVKRKSNNLGKGSEQDTYKWRLRWKPAPSMRKSAEVEMTEAEYIAVRNKENIKPD